MLTTVYVCIYIYMCRHGTILYPDSLFLSDLWNMDHGCLKSMLAGHVRFCGNLCGKLDGTPGALSKGGATVEWHNVERFSFGFSVSDGFIEGFFEDVFMVLLGWSF